MTALAKNSVARSAAAAVLVTCLAIAYLKLSGRMPVGASLISALAAIAVETVATTVGERTTLVTWLPFSHNCRVCRPYTFDHEA